MIKHNIILVECNPLYQILFEIKNNFLFEMKNFILKDLNKADLTNSIILSKFINKDYLFKNKNIEQKKIIFLLKKNENFNKINNTQYIFYPFNIYDLVEKINTELIKQKYNDQSFIKILNYSLDINSRIISNESGRLKLTEREVDIILFLNDHKKPQKVNILQNQVWKYSSELETHTVETHIYRLRKKIIDKFKDDNFILSDENGYFIK
ncbi:MAG: response regulator transcription factor [Pelagibacterales bacterium]|nr:response regulator transcription factor [Pelagibacterales bacterium]